MAINHQFESRLTVDFKRLDNIENACTEWGKLQHHRSSVFLSLAWIRPWLLTIKDNGNIFVAYFLDDNKKIVGMAFFVMAKLRRRKLFFVDQLSLNESEKHGEKFIVEYNNILFDPVYLDDVYYSFIDFAANSPFQFDEIKLNTIAVDNVFMFKNICNKFNLKFFEEKSSKAYYAELSGFQSDPDLFHASLSKNKREQIKRSIKYFKQFGEQEIEIAATRDLAVDYFKEMGELHQQYWNKKGMPGAFADSKWVEFHIKIINDYFDHIQMIRLSYGDHVIGYLYNLVDNDTAYSIQSGFNYSDNKNDRPGIVSHYLLTGFYIEKSFKKYEYLAGEMQYKKSLSTNCSRFGWYYIQRKSLLIRLENLIVGIARFTKSLAT